MTTSVAEQARAVERFVFGALIGALAGTLACRLAFLAVDVNVFAIMALLGIGAWSGGFLTHWSGGRSESAVESMRAWALRFRQVCLRVMLWLLGAAAVFGVLSVLTASYDIVGRIAATACITGVAAGLLWPFSVLIDQDKHRGVGLFGVASVLLVYFLVTPSIWNFGHREEEAAIAGLLVTLMSPAGLIAMLMLNQRQTRVAGLFALAVYVIVLGVFLVAIWYPGRWHHNERLWETGFALAGFGALAAACLVGLGTGDRRHWKWLGVLTAVVAAGYCVWAIWRRPGEFAERTLFVITSVSMAVAHANLVMLVPLRGAQHWLRWGTIAAAAATAVGVDMVVVLDLNTGRQVSMTARLALAAGILASCGTLALVVLACLNRTMAPRTEGGKLASITLACPRCGKRQTLPLEVAASCARCDLQIQVLVEESRVEKPPDLAAAWPPE